MTKTEPINPTTIAAIMGAVQAFLDLGYDSPIQKGHESLLRKQPNMWKYKHSFHIGTDAILQWKSTQFSSRQIAKPWVEKMSWR